MRKQWIRFLLPVFVVMIIACGCTPKESEPMVGNNEVGIIDESPVDDSVTVTLYYANTMLTDFVSEEVQLSELTPDEIIDYLSSHNIVSTDTRMTDFFLEDGDTTIVHLNLNKQFKEYIKLMSEEGEYYIIGSLTNSFLSAYHADSMILQVEDTSLSTKYNEYTEPLFFYSSEDIEDTEEN